MTGRLVRGRGSDPPEEGLSVLWLDICRLGLGGGSRARDACGAGPCGSPVSENNPRSRG